MATTDSRLLMKLWKSLVALVMVFFVVNVALMVAAVATSSVARRWLGTWLPEGYTLNWYLTAWKEFQLGSVLWVTIEVVAAVVFLAILIGVPAAHALARRDFRGKRLLMGLFLIPLMVPPITYGIPLASVMYQAHIAGTIFGVILANMIPAVPFMILVMAPFIEQIDVNLESAGGRITRLATVRAAANDVTDWLVPLGEDVRSAGVLEVETVDAQAEDAAHDRCRRREAGLPAVGNIGKRKALDDIDPSPCPRRTVVRYLGQGTGPCERLTAVGPVPPSCGQRAGSADRPAVLASPCAGPSSAVRCKGTAMNSDHVKGTVKDAAGKVQQKTGQLIDSPEQQAKGIAKQVEGKTQKKVGDVKDAAKAITRKP